MRNGWAVIVSHNSGAAINACLLAVLADPSWNALVVDNASSDSTTRYAAQISGRVRLVRNQVNRGFAAAANQGHSLAAGPITVLLNPDALACPGALQKLAAAFDDPAVGAVGGALLDEQGRTQRGFQFRRFPTLGAMLCEVLLVNRIWRGNPWNRQYRCLDLDDSQPQFVEQPAGACLAVRREAWESVGGFDEGFYPVWFEDVDFCRRLANRGWKIAYRPDARFSHVGGHSVSKLPFRDRQSYWYRNMLRYFGKHHGRLKTAILRTGILAGLTLRAALSLTGFGPRSVSIREALRGYIHAARTALQRGDRPGAARQHSVGVAPV